MVRANESELPIAIHGARPLLGDVLALRLAQEPGIEVLAAGNRPSGPASLPCCREPRVLLVHADPAAGPVGDLLADLRDRHPHAGIVAMIDGGDSRTAAECFEAGAKACLEADAPYQIVCETLRAVATGRTAGSLTILAALLRRIEELRAAADPPATNSPPLTDRENEVADLIGQGLSNKQIAKRMGRKISTVKSHVGRILRKQRVTRRRHVGAPEPITAIVLPIPTAD